MIGAPNSLNLNCKVRVMKEAPGPSVSEEIADIFTNYSIDNGIRLYVPVLEDQWEPILNCCTRKHNFNHFEENFVTGSLSKLDWVMVWCCRARSHHLKQCWQGSMTPYAVTYCHWGRDKMAAISQTTVSITFSWMKMIEIWLKFHWSLFLRVQLTIFQHWLR